MVHHSRLPTSSQVGIHARLDEIVRRHQSTPWLQPVREHNQRAFDRIRTRVAEDAELILDSGCGTGHSTVRLAEEFPQATVVGIDKSEARLTRAPVLPDNAVLVRADLADFWRLASAAGWRPGRHFLLYPNPWPKAVHLQRRWHGHPVFPDLVALGGRLELRTNFGLYAEEFQRALRVVGACQVNMVSFTPDKALSPFEVKYLESGHTLYRLTANLEILE